jgi:hypothetical protein
MIQDFFVYVFGPDLSTVLCAFVCVFTYIYILTKILNNSLKQAP